jgi:hypothetical protein
MLAIFLFIIVFTLFCNLTHRSKSEYRQHMRKYMTYNPARFTRHGVNDSSPAFHYANY